jgi:hypothetical protein
MMKTPKTIVMVSAKKAESTQKERKGKINAAPPKITF